MFRANQSMQINWRTIPSLLSWGVSFLRNSTPERFFAATEDNYRLASYSRDKTLELTARLELEFDLLDSGTLCIFRNPKEMAERRAISEHLAPLGMPSREIDPDEIVALEPLLQDIAGELAGGFWFSGDVMGDAHLFCRELAREIVAGGGVIDTGMQVCGLVARNGKLTGIDTNRGRIDADRVVVAAGVRSPQILRGIGRSLPVKPAKGYSLTFDCAGLGDLPGVAIVDEAAHAVVSRFGDRVRVVGTAEFAGFDKSIGRKRIDRLAGVFESLLPGLASKVDRDSATLWAGLRPMSNDGRPFIGPGKVEGLFINSGHGALGWTMAMGAAHLLADLVLGTPTEIDGRPFLPFRD